MVDDSDKAQIKESINDMEDAVAHIRENRPDDPEAVSYALDDLELQITELQMNLKNNSN
jgi:hypothetical protein